MTQTFSQILNDKIYSEPPVTTSLNADSSADFHLGILEASCLSELRIMDFSFIPRRARTGVYAPVTPSPVINYLLSESQKTALDFMNHYLPLAFQLDGAFSLYRLKKGFRLLALEFHPDHGGSAESFRELRTQYKILLDLLISIK